MAASSVSSRKRDVPRTPTVSFFHELYKGLRYISDPPQIVFAAIANRGIHLLPAARRAWAARMRSIRCARAVPEACASGRRSAGRP